MNNDTLLRRRLSQRLGAPKGGGAQIAFRCPFCAERRGSESSKYKLSVHVQKQLCHCWRCEYSGTIRTLLRDLSGGRLTAEDWRVLDDEPVVDATDNIRSIVRSQLIRPTTPKTRSLKPVRLPPEARRVTAQDKLTRSAYNYLMDRGVDQKTVERFDVHYAPRGPYANYLLFPIHQFGDMVYFATRLVDRGRSTTRNKPKSRNPASTQDAAGRNVYYTKSQCLLNFDNVDPNQPVYIVEGPFDCMAVPNSVAILGKRVSAEQIHLLQVIEQEEPTKFVVALDAEAVEDAISMQARLTAYLDDVEILNIESGDPFDNKDRLSEIPARKPSVSDTVSRRLSAY